MALEDKVNEILGIDTPKEKENKEFKPPVARVEEKAKDDVDNDHKNSREYYYNLIDQGQEAIANNDVAVVLGNSAGGSKRIGERRPTSKSLRSGISRY